MWTELFLGELVGGKGVLGLVVVEKLGGGLVDLEDYLADFLLLEGLEHQHDLLPIYSNHICT